ncbi:MAG: hypothetical protein NC828_01415 [Candidatus Omnitrophica bacterium]|nr:hypothetical protein [Candidatus Omnitrophota bacterium]
MLKISHYLKDNLVMFISGSMAGLFNLLYQLLMLRTLPIKVYGELNSLLSLFLIVALPFTSFTTMVARFISKFNAQGEYMNLKVFLATILRHSFILGIGVFILTNLLTPILAFSLQLDSTLPIIFLAIILFLSTIIPVLSGGLQGLEKFAWLAGATTVSGFFKISLAFIFLILSLKSLSAALGVIIISLLFALLISVWPLKEYIFKIEKESYVELKEAYSYLLPTFSTLLCFSLLTNIDIVLVKHFFSPILAGTYSIAQIIGKIILFLPGTVSLVMFPRTSFLHTQSKDTLHTLKRSLIYAVALCAFSVIIFNISPQQILNIITKKAGTDYVILARLFSICMAFFALGGILLFYQLSINNFKFMKFLINLTIFQILAVTIFSIFYKSLFIVLIILCVDSFILFIANFRSAFERT